MKRVLAVLQLRNEEINLPGCLEHLRGFVDGAVALDDGSHDATSQILARDPLVVDVISKPVSTPGEPHIWDELGNKRELLDAAKAHGAHSVLVCDADERMEIAFLADLRRLVAKLSDVRVAIWCRELWDRPDCYRVDGIWGSVMKMRTRLFPLSPVITYADNEALHGAWEPDLIRKRPLRRLRSNFYHLKMIRAVDRIARRDFYNRLDPEREQQAMGYDYLADETGLAVERIPVGKEYAYETLPPELRALLG